MLEVGDVLYNGKATERIVIDRVTAKRAYTKHYEFDRDVVSNTMGIRRRGTDSWSQNAYWHPETLELVEKYNNYARMRKCKTTLDCLVKEVHTYTPEQITILYRTLDDLVRELNKEGVQNG
jgi:hypothetical protein